MRRKYFKEDILYKGMELVSTKGYHNTGINDILKACGIPKGSFYNFFESKEDFALQVIDLCIRECEKVFSESLTDTRFSPLERIGNLYEALMRLMEKGRYSNGTLLGNLSLEIGGLYENLARPIAIGYQKEIDALTACVREGQETGDISNRHPAAKLAEYVHNSINGSLIQMKSERDGAPLRRSIQMTLEILRPD